MRRAARLIAALLGALCLSAGLMAPRASEANPCGPPEEATLRPVLPDCAAPPAGLWPAELPLMFMWSAARACCSPPDGGCKPGLVEGTMESLVSAAAVLLSAAPTQGAAPRAIVQTGLVCGGARVWAISGGPLVPGRYAVGGAEVEVRAGALDAATLKHYETLDAFSSSSGVKAEPKPARDALMKADGTTRPARRWWLGERRY
jgi:hypothetical protein